MRNLKTLGLALVAVLALTAVVASAAQAANGKITAAEYPATLTGEQEGTVNYFEVGGVKTECGIGKFHATIKEASSTVTFKPTYEKCTTPLGSATIDTNKCGYLFHVGTGDEADDIFNATVDIECEKVGEDFTVTAGACIIHVAQQNGVGGITLTNITGSPKDVTADIESTVAVTGTNVFLCPSSVTSAKTGKYVSKVTVKAFKDPGSEGAQIDGWIST